MYKLVFLPLAKKDMEEIIYYISHNLKNIKATVDLINEFGKQEQKILTFPYGASVYKTFKSCKYEYRKVSVKNFNMFYIIDEDKKLITVSRILYNKRNIEKILK